MSMNPEIKARERTSDGRGASDDALVRLLSGFGPLSADERASLARLTATPRTVVARTELIDEGDEIDAAPVVLDGFACRYRVRWEGRRQILAYLLPGDLYDLDFMLRERTDDGVATMTACRVAFIPRWALQDLVRNHPNIIKALRLAKLSQEARLRDWVMMLGCGSATERVAHLFCEVLYRLQAVGLATADSCDMLLTQTEMGDAVGVSTIHINRVLQELRGKNLIELKSRKLRILDVPRLRALAAYKPLLSQPAGDDGRSAPDNRKPMMSEPSRPHLDRGTLAG